MNIEFDAKKFKELKSLYNKSIKEGHKSFFFYGHELQTDYVKYLIEFLNQKFSHK